MRLEWFTGKPNPHNLSGLTVSPAPRPPTMFLAGTWYGGYPSFRWAKYLACNADRDRDKTRARGS